MPKISTPLSDTKIKNLKPKDKEYKLSDGDKLYLFIKPNGRKHFALEYKSPVTQKIRRIALGDYPTLTLANARKKRAELLEALQEGNDPLMHKGKMINTLNKIGLEWLEIKNATNTQSYAKKQLLVFNKHVSKYLGDRDINAISTVDIINTLKIIEDSGSLETLKRIFSLLNQIYKYAVSYGYTKHNIIADISFRYTFKQAKTKNYPTLTKTNDIRGLILSIDEYNGDYKTKVALKLLMNTAVRPFNIRACEWNEIDFKNKLWVIPAEKMKMKQEFILPLSTQAMDLLKDYRLVADKSSNYLFASLRSADRCMSDNTLNAALRRLGYSKDEIVSHGFRAMFSTLANELRDDHQCGIDIIEKCLAHADKDKIRDAYNRASNLKQMRVLMQWWGDYLSGLIS